MSLLAKRIGMGVSPVSSAGGDDLKKGRPPSVFLVSRCQVSLCTAICCSHMVAFGSLWMCDE